MGLDQKNETMLSAKDIVCRMYCGILVVIWILAPYAILQNVSIRSILWMPETELDKAIPVCFWGLWLYVSFYLLLGIVGLTLEKRVFIRYLYTIGWATMVAHMIFLFVPNGVSREDIDPDSSPWLYQLLVSLDKPRNAFPSLHACLSVIAALAVQASVFSKFSSLPKFLIKSGTWLWVAGIFWSTIALRQHVLLDLLSGTLIAILVWRVMRDSFEMEYHIQIEEV